MWVSINTKHGMLRDGQQMIANFSAHFKDFCASRWLFRLASVMELWFFFTVLNLVLGTVVAGRRRLRCLDKISLPRVVLEEIKTLFIDNSVQIFAKSVSRFVSPKSQGSERTLWTVWKTDGWKIGSPSGVISKTFKMGFCPLSSL